MTIVKAAALAVLLAPLQSSLAQVSVRPFAVHDSIEMSFFGTRINSAPPDLDDDGVMSPDGRYFIEVTHRGVLPEGKTEGTIWLFDAALVQQAIRHGSEVPRPRALARMLAAVNSGLGLDVLDAGNTVTSPQWADDSRSLTFLGRNARANRQLFRVDVNTGEVTALTGPDQDVLTYSRSGGTIAYLVGPNADLQAARAWNSAGPEIPDVTVGTSTSLMPLLYPHFRGNAFGEPLAVELWYLRDGRAASVNDFPGGSPARFVTTYTTLLVTLSPDATRVITIAADEGPDTQPEYRVVELTSGKSKRVDGVSLAPERERYRAAWMPDGNALALGKVLVKDDRTATEDQAMCQIAVVRTGSGETRCIVRPDAAGGTLVDIQWPKTNEIRAQYTAKGNSAAYKWKVFRKKGNAWLLDQRASHPAIELSIRESLNEPPVLVAMDASSGKQRVIFDPNPQLADIALGSASVYRWKDPYGREIEGGLLLPPAYETGKRYALVIQTHGFNPHKFFRSGYSDTSNAGRPLAGRDLIVLQVQEPRAEGEPSWRDGIHLGLDVYLAAIDSLASENKIDPARVGISGYSYSGWLVANAITHAPQRFAAAEIGNSDPVTLTGYYGYVPTSTADVVAKYYVGAKPYGEGLKTWIDRVPSFATEKVTAPVLFQPADPWHLIGMWDMYAALLDQGKPVELQYIRTGEHNIRKPLQVLAHQEMIVDWFDFWLNDHEVNDPAKVQQYARWRGLRNAQSVAR